MTDARLHRIALIATGGLAVVIAGLTLYPFEDGVPAPGRDGDMGLYLSVSLAYHVVAFGALVWPVTASRPRSALWAVPAATAYGGVIELIQPHVGRTGSWEDALANALGACMGAALGWLAHCLWRRRARA